MQLAHLSGTRRSAPVAALMLAMSLAAIGAPTVMAANGGGETAAVGAVYVATNAWSPGNEILTFPRYANGSLGPVSSVTATGGRGSGPGQFAPIVNDPLGSQNSLITDAKGKLLFAVNAGSGSVSSFSVGRAGLTLVDTAASVPSGVTGQANPFPVSLAYASGRLYVLNAIGNSVTEFVVGPSGHLASSTNCALPGLPSGNPLDQYPATDLSS